MSARYPRATRAQLYARWGRFNHAPRDLARPAIAKIGKRFYWITWRFNDPGADPWILVLTDGFADTRDQAVVDAAKALGVEPQEALLREGPAHSAESEYRERHVIKHQAKTTCAQADLGYVYEHHSGWSDFDSSRYESWTPHRITKITRKKIFIKAGADGYHGLDGNRQYTLDRESLERDGYATRGDGRGTVPYTYYYSEEGKRRYEARLAEPQRVNGGSPDLALLGLEPGCTHPDILRAFRRLSKLHHPDHGGDAAVFRELVAAKDRMLARLAGAET